MLRWVSPFGHPRIVAHLQLPEAFRSLSRPSSAPDAKAFPLRSFSLDRVEANSADSVSVPCFRSVRKLHLFRCFSFPNSTRFTGLEFGDKRLSSLTSSTVENPLFWFSIVSSVCFDTMTSAADVGFCRRTRLKVAGILCVFQGFHNAALRQKTRRMPMPLCQCYAI